ncbi:MAG: cytochrome c biogenesis protein CcdA, partial [Bacillota bacterium]
AAGFADGINPCAFAILVFLVSYLMFAGRSRRQIVATGVAFAAGVFATYLTAGFGILEATRFLRRVSLLHRAVYLVAAVLCFGLAALTIHDLMQVRLGASSAVRLRLPRRLTRFAHTAIRRASASPYLAAAALLTGAVVATTEFVCTGQLYLPTILYVLQTADDVRRPASMLVLYNVAFVAPMLSAVALVSLGTTSERLAALTKRHAAAIRTAIAAVFLCLGVYLGLGFLRMLGLVA